MKHQSSCHERGNSQACKRCWRNKRRKLAHHTWEWGPCCPWLCWGRVGWPCVAPGSQLPVGHLGAAWLGPRQHSQGVPDKERGVWWCTEGPRGGKCWHFAEEFGGNCPAQSSDIWKLVGPHLHCWWGYSTEQLPGAKSHPQILCLSGNSVLVHNADLAKDFTCQLKYLQPPNYFCQDESLVFIPSCFQLYTLN